MGRFYKSESATPLDYMYHMDSPLMEKALIANDQYIDQNLATAQQVGQQANFNYIAQDEADAQKIIGGYTQKVNDLADAIKKDPANWRKQVTPINDLKQQLITDYTTGAISKYAGNYQRRKTAFDALDKQVEAYNKTGGKDKQGNDVGVDPLTATRAKQYWDENFKGTKFDPNNPHAANIYRADGIMNNIDIKKRLSEGFDKLKADGTVKTRTTLTGGEQYLDETTNKWKGLTQDKILGIVMNNLQGDQGLHDYLRQRSQIGAMHGVFYDQDVKDPTNGSTIHRAGEMINPYDMIAKKATPEEQSEITSLQASIDKIKNLAIKAQQQSILDQHKSDLADRQGVQWSNQSSLAPVLKGIVGQYANGETESSEKLKPNSIWSTKFIQGQENNRLGAQLKQKQDQFEVVDKRLRDFHADEFGDKLQDNQLARDKFEWEKDHPKGTKGATVPGAKTPVVNPLPSETTTSNLATNSLEDITTLDLNNKVVPKYSAAGIAADIVHSKTQLDDINDRIVKNNAVIRSSPNSVEANVANIQNQQLTVQRTQIQTDLGQTRDIYNKTTEAVLNNSPKAGTPLNSEEVSLYNQFSTDRDATKFKDHITKLQEQYPRVIVDKSMQAAIDRAEKDMNTALVAWRGAAETPKFAGYVDVKGQAASKYWVAKKSMEQLQKAAFRQDSPEVASAKEVLSKYLSAKGRVDKNRDNLLGELRKTYIDADAIVPTQTESDQTWGILSGNSQGLELYDDSGKRATSVSNGVSSMYGGKGTETNGLGFETGLKDYINVHNVKVKIGKISTTTRLGNGNGVVQVEFDDPNGQLSKKPYYISLSPEATRDISNKFKTHKNPAVAKIANDMMDGDAISIRNQIAQPKVNSLIGRPEAEHSFDIMVTNLQGNRQLLNITRLPESDKISVTMKDPDGKTHIFPFGRHVSHGTTPGTFNGISDFIENFKDVKYNGIIPQ